MRVLLVEDNPVDAATLGDRLAERAPEGESSIEMSHVSSLAELAMQGNANELDVLLLDLSLPDGFGAGSIRRARTLVGEVPIVVLTADDDEQRSLEMLREGAEDYLVKGKYNADTLVRALRYACERHALKQRLAHADRLAAVGQLSAGVAHEVANPAALALANNDKLGALLDELLSVVTVPERVRQVAAECKRVADDNRTALERIRAVVRDLQTYARLERSRVERVQLNDIVERTCNLVYASLRHGATLEKDLAALPMIAADEGKIEQVLTNLLINSLHALEAVDDKARPGGKRIVVTTRLEAGDTICIGVADNGIGMTDAVRQRAFEPFFTTKREHGTGLGLAIAVEIVRRHRGEITCATTPGEGSRFDVRIPVDTGLHLADAPAEPEASPQPKRGRVLLIDDERAVAMVYGELLSMHHEVVVAHGGRPAVEQLASGERFDVVVCDLMMPELDGMAVYEIALEKRPDLATRFVFCSGGLVTARARDLAAKPNTRLLYKPVSIDDMLRAIDAVIVEHAPARSTPPL